MKAGAQGRECLILWAMHQDDARNGSDTWWVGPLAAGVWLLCNGARRCDRGAADRLGARGAAEVRTEEGQGRFHKFVATSDRVRIRCQESSLTLY